MPRTRFKQLTEESRQNSDVIVVLPAAWAGRHEGRSGFRFKPSIKRVSVVFPGGPPMTSHGRVEVVRGGKTAKPDFFVKLQT